MIHQIKHRHTGAVLFECDVPADLQVPVTRYVLEQAIKAGAHLTGARLTGADLTGAIK